MGCSNCYNGCTEIVSDRCVKYTGIDVPILGIKSGDSLSYVEQALIEFLTATLDGSGIKINLPPSAYCEVVTKYLPDCEDVTAYNLFEALVKAACDIQAQVTVLRGEMDTLNADYAVGCLSGVTNSSDTHAVLQAVINKLCQLGVDLAALQIDVDTNYVKLSELDALIQAYLDSTPPPPTATYKDRMVPYTIVAFYGDISGKFDGTGAGFGDWDSIYLCNGQNGTPDLRGRSIIGVTDNLQFPGGAMSPTVNPASNPAFNYNYTLGSTGNGTNSVTLLTSQIPSHLHAITDKQHSHSITVSTSGSDSPNGVANYPVFNSTNEENQVKTNPVGLNGTLQQYTGITATLETGGGAAHNNVHPVLATIYIMYIP